MLFIREMKKIYFDEVEIGLEGQKDVSSLEGTTLLKKKKKRVKE